MHPLTWPGTIVVTSLRPGLVFSEITRPSTTAMGDPSEINAAVRETDGPTAGTPATWYSWGDAAHTAHFSVGSGRKMAMEDATPVGREDLKLGPAELVLRALPCTSVCVVPEFEWR